VRFKLIFYLYLFLFVILTVFSYGFVDPNFPFKTLPFLHQLVYYQRPLATAIYLMLVLGLFFLYGWVLRGISKRKLNAQQIWQLVFLAVVILFFSFPAFSHDVFNYMATAKVTFFYKENPYLVMPIEFIGEPMLDFMHAANKIALYGPFWILLTALPHAITSHLFLSIFSFKALMMAFYLGLIWLIWRVSKKSKYSLAFFALNPLVLMETLVSAHNDVVMAFFALLGLYWLLQKKKVFSFASLLASIGIKYATIVLLPIFAFSSRLKKEKIILFSAWALLFVFLLSPLREEIYSWYLIWALAFVALLPKRRFLFWLTLAFSFGTLCRYLPFLYTRSWEGITPMIKRGVTFAPPAIMIITFFLKQTLPRKFKL